MKHPVNISTTSASRSSGRLEWQVSKGHILLNPQVVKVVGGPRFLNLGMVKGVRGGG